MAQTALEDNNNHYAKDAEYWNKYIKGRPQIPDSLFERVARYHASRGGHFGRVHDVGGGVGVYSNQLAKYFEHVILSDVVESNLDIAKDRLGTEGKFSFKTMSVDEVDALPEGSVDMVFAANMIHFANFDDAFQAFYKQLKPGGTLAVVCYAIGVLKDPKLDKIWREIWFDGLKVLLRHAKDRQARLLTFWKSNCTGYDNVPLSEEYFEPGATRTRLNSAGGWPTMMPSDLQEECREQFGANPGMCMLADSFKFDSMPLNADDLSQPSDQTIKS